MLADQLGHSLVGEYLGKIWRVLPDRVEPHDLGLEVDQADLVLALFCHFQGRVLRPTAAACPTVHLV